MKDCFTPHALTHSLAGFGIGLIVAALVPGLDKVLFGAIIVIVAVVLDYMRK